MATRYEITNISTRPLGFPEVGKSKTTEVGRGETAVLTVHASIGRLIEKMGDKPIGGGRAQLEVSNLGEVADLDHDGDGRMGGGRKKTVETSAPAPKPAAPPPPAPKPADGANDGLDFDSLEDDQLRAYLAGNEVKFHPNTGRVKLLEKAKEHEADAAKAAAAAAKKAGAENADPAEAV